MAALSDLRADVKVYANNCPDVTVDKYLVQAIRDFCQDTWYYQQSLVINQTAGTSIYQIVPGNGDEVIAIEAADQADTALTPLDQHEAGDVVNMFGSGFQFEPPNFFVIYPEPTETIANNIQLRLVLQPPEGTTTLPDSIYRNFKQTIVSGALSYILSMNNEAWSNPDLAMVKLKEFTLGKFLAKGQRMRGFIPGPIRIRPRSFAI